MSWAILFRLRNEMECIDGWFKCLRCIRFFTKRADELYCHDCLQELHSR